MTSKISPHYESLTTQTAVQCHVSVGISSIIRAVNTDFCVGRGGNTESVIRDSLQLAINPRYIEGIGLRLNISIE